MSIAVVATKGEALVWNLKIDFSQSLGNKRKRRKKRRLWIYEKGKDVWGDITAI